MFSRIKIVSVQILSVDKFLLNFLNNPDFEVARQGDHPDIQGQRRHL